MATVRITYWRDIPMLVTARDGGGEVSVPLGPAFQDLVDRVAMQDGLAGEDAYLAEWHVGPPEEASGGAGRVAHARARAPCGRAPGGPDARSSSVSDAPRPARLTGRAVSLRMIPR